MKCKTLVLSVIAALLICGCGKKEAEQPAGSENPKKAPAFTLKSFDGKEISLADCKGKIVVLEWINVQCPFVRYHYEQAGTMKRLADKYKDKGVVWLAIDSTSGVTDEQVKEFIAKHNITYPVLDDRAGKVGRAYGAKTTPHMFIIDKQGQIVYNGAIDNAPMGKSEGPAVNYVDKALSELLAGKSVSISNSKPYGCSVKYID